MKTPTWPQVALIAVLLTAAIVAPHFAGASASSIVNAACVLLAWLTDGPSTLMKGPSQ